MLEVRKFDKRVELVSDDRNAENVIVGEALQTAADELYELAKS